MGYACSSDDGQQNYTGYRVFVGGTVVRDTEKENERADNIKEDGGCKKIKSDSGGANTVLWARQLDFNKTS